MNKYKYKSNCCNIFPISESELELENVEPIAVTGTYVDAAAAGRAENFVRKEAKKGIPLQKLRDIEVWIGDVNRNVKYREKYELARVRMRKQGQRISAHTIRKILLDSGRYSIQEINDHMAWAIGMFGI